MRLCLAVVLALTGSAAAAPAVSAHDDIVHRVVWADLSGSQVQVFSAELDGTDRRRIFRQKDRGLIGAMAMNSAGTQVALVPLNFRTYRKRLVVADVAGGSARDLLHDDRILSVDAPGWSPNGRRIVFEGVVDVAGKNTLFLWSISRNGTRLTKLARIPDDMGFSPGKVTPWTTEGIFFSDNQKLYRLEHGRLEVVLGRTAVVRASGDGRWLILTRYHDAETSLWRMRPDGSGLESLVAPLNPDVGERFVRPLMPNHDGSQMLSMVFEPDETERVFSHPVTRAPRDDDPVLDFVTSMVLWN